MLLKKRGFFPRLKIKQDCSQLENKNLPKHAEFVSNAFVRSKVAFFEMIPYIHRFEIPGAAIFFVFAVYRAVLDDFLKRIINNLDDLIALEKKARVINNSHIELKCKQRT